MAAVERDIAAQDAVPKPEPEPITATDEGQSMPRRKNEPEQSPMAQVLAARFPWLAELEARAIKEFGPKPDKDGSKAAYNRWIMNRKTLMNKSQLAEFEGFYGRGRAKAEATKRALREAAKGGKEPAAQPVNGKIKVTVETVEGTAAEIQALQAQHAELEQQLALHPEALSHAVSDPRSEPISEGPRRVANRPTWTATATASAADMAEEIARMQRIITVLTAENMRLRGIL
jgi:hypothetical protein